MMNGSVNSSRMGFRTALNRLSSKTTTIRVVPSEQEIPGTSFVARITPSASTSHLTSNWVIRGGKRLTAEFSATGSFGQ